MYQALLGYHLSSSEIVMYEHVSISSSVVVRVIILAVDIYIKRGIKSYSVMNSISLLGYVGSS